jgi:hypothetical protein
MPWVTRDQTGGFTGEVVYPKPGGDVHRLPETVPGGWRTHPSGLYWSREPAFGRRNGPSFNLEAHPHDGKFRPVVMDFDIKTDRGTWAALDWGHKPPMPLSATLAEACAAAERAYCGCYVARSTPKDPTCP